MRSISATRLLWSYGTSVVALSYAAGLVLSGSTDATEPAAFAAGWVPKLPGVNHLDAVRARFWIALSVLSQKAIVVQTIKEFAARYRQLGSTLGGFLARNLAAVAVGGLAIVLAVYAGLYPLGRVLDVRI